VVGFHLYGKTEVEILDGGYEGWKDFRKNVDDAPTEFKTVAGIKKVIAEHGIDKIKNRVFHCQSGVQTTTRIFSLYLMGWDLNRLQDLDGTSIEWSYREKNPVDAGASSSCWVRSRGCSRPSLVPHPLRDPQTSPRTRPP